MVLDRGYTGTALPNLSENTAQFSNRIGSNGRKVLNILELKNTSDHFSTDWIILDLRS